MLFLVGLSGILLLTVGIVQVRGALRAERVGRRLRGFVLGLVFLIAGGLCIGLQAALHAFEAFSRAEVVAEVRCTWLGPKQFSLTWTPARRPLFTPPAAKTFEMRGDQWSVSGGIVKWHPWLTAIGLPSYHKVNRLSGRYANVEEETAGPPTAFPLNGEIDRLWWWFYRLQGVLPFVEATYGSAAYTYVNPAVVFEVSVTPSGYLIKKRTPPPTATRRRR